MMIKLNIHPQQNKNFIKLLVSFALVLLLVGVVMSISTGVVHRVSTTTEQLIKFQIPELSEIADAQNLVATISNNLHQYYATLDRANYIENERYIAQFKKKIDRIFYIKKQTQLNQALKDSLARLIIHANQLDMEMRAGDQHNWDALREELYAAEAESKVIMDLLNTFSTTIRSNVEENSLSAQREVKHLNLLQLGFSFAILVATLFIVANLYFRIKDQAELYKRAYYNDISNLPNRKYFEQNLAKSLSDYPNYSVTFFLINLDRFSLISESMGYIFGDRLIKAISEWLVNKLKTFDEACKIYHFSGTSWLVMLPNCQDEKQAIQVTNALSSMSTASMNLSDREMTCTCSVGIYFSVDRGIDGEELLSNLDAALRGVKKLGGNGYCFYHTNMSLETKRWIDTENAMRHAIEKREFELFYQPKVDAQTGKVRGAEALLRWRKNGELISPAVFIPIAESSNLIIKIGKWVLVEACAQWVRWQKEGLPAMPIAINISAQQFQEADFPTQVQAAINHAGIPAQMLELEITEEAAAHDPKRVVEIMQQLKKIGVSLAIDDFGTGYSSLSHLRNFPVDVLKIDRAFIKDMAHSEADRSIVQLILQLAKQLNFKVVAEGVETEAQYQQLKRWRCDLIQGFLFSKPLPAAEFALMLSQEHAKSQAQETIMYKETVN